jgi:multidrug resistance efflux pump
LKQASEARPGLIAEQELDDATAKDRSAEAQVDAAKSALAASRQQLEVSQADQQHYAALSEFSRIVAPFDGVVTGGTPTQDRSFRLALPTSVRCQW